MDITDDGGGAPWTLQMVRESAVLRGVLHKRAHSFPWTVQTTVQQTTDASHFKHSIWEMK